MVFKRAFRIQQLVSLRRGGGGAPLRDAGGNLVADLRGVDIHAPNQNQNVHHQHSPGRWQQQQQQGGGANDHHDPGVNVYHASQQGAGVDIPGMPRRGVNAGQGDYSSPLRRAGGGPSSFRLGGGDPVGVGDFNGGVAIVVVHATLWFGFIHST